MPAILLGLGDFAAAALAYLSAVAAFLLAVAAVWLWWQLVRPIFLGVAHILPGGWKVLGQTIVPDLRGAWLNLETAVYNELVRYRTDSEAAVAFTWHWMAEAWRWNAGMVEWLAKETDATFDALAHIHLPKWAKWIIAGAFPPLLIARLLKALAPHLRTVVVKPIRVIEHQLPGRTRVIVKQIGAQAIPDVWRIPGFPDVWHGLTRRFARIHWRLSRLEKLLTATGIAAVVATMLGVTSRCLRRGNLGRAARSVCGLDAGMFESLLGDLIAITSVLSVVEFATELRTVEDEAVAIMGRLVREWPS